MDQTQELHGPTVVLTVGAAASGKSTLLRDLHERGVVDRTVSTDAIRAELGLAPDETTTAYAEARARVVTALRAGEVVAVDATNVRRADRARWLAVAEEVGATPVAVRVGVGLDLEQLQVRDAGRDRHVPPEVIAEQLRLARASTPDVLAAEGFTVTDGASTRLVRRAAVGRG